MKLPTLLCLALAALPAWLPGQDSVAVNAGRIITVTGPTLENATILIENGLIKAVGQEIEVPWNAEVIDASDKVVMPTYVLAHTSGGLSRGANENLANVPYLTVADGIDPVEPFFEEALRNGIGTIHVLPGNNTVVGGQGMVVRPTGRTVEDMAVAKGGLKLSLSGDRGSRIAQIRRLRRAITDVEEYLADFERRKTEFEQEKAAGALPADAEWTEEYDKNKKPLIDLLERKVTAWLYVPSAAEVDEAIRLAQRFNTVLVLGPQCYKAVAPISIMGVPVVLEDQMEFYETDEETDEELRVCTAATYAGQAVEAAYSVAASGNRRYPWWQMATAVRHGVDRQTALRSMTIIPAAILGLDDQLGSIETGKVANLQILSGDPLQATTWVETVLLEGEVVYERATDPRLKHLFGKDR